VVEESHSVKLAAQLADAGYVVVVHDPLARTPPSSPSRQGGRRARRWKAVCASGSADRRHSWPEYKEIDAAWCKRANGRLTVLDLWRTLPAGKLDDVADVLYLGSGR